MRLAATVAAALMGATLLAAGPALADAKGCPPGHAKKGWCSSGGWDKPWERGRRHSDRGWDDDDDDDRRWRSDRRARERAYEQGYQDAMRDAWRVGQRLPRNRYRVVPDFDQFGWPQPGEGRGYVRYDDQYYLVNLATGIILDILTR